MAANVNNNLLSKKLECPICLDYLESPIRQCVIGHSFCTKCIDPQFIKKCPECRSNILETRNFKLEELIESIRDFECDNVKAGCRYKSNKDGLKQHMLECQFKKMKCEGKQFCNWDCNWEGHSIQDHFKDKHAGHCSLEFNAKFAVTFNSSSNFTDLQLVSAFYHLFWYKHKIDTNKGKAFWAFQIIGSQKLASCYYYEFEINSSSSLERKFKITDYCNSDSEKIEDIFESEKCVAISLKALKSYVDNKNEYFVRFRIMKVAKTETTPHKTQRPVPKKYFPPRK